MRTSKAILFGILTTIFILLLVDTSSAKAAPLVYVPVTLTQPDGEVLYIFASGDEYYNWLHDLNGYTIVQDPKTGYYVYANLVNGILVPTGAVVGRTNPAAVGLRPNLNISPEQMEAIRNQALTQTADAPGNEILDTPQSGTINNLVVFIRFSDESEYSEPASTYTDMLNSSADGYNSLYNYYKEVSYNTLFMHSRLYPVPGANIVSFQDSHPRGYFEPYDATTNPAGYTGGNYGGMRTEREHTLLKEAVTYVNGLGQFPSAADVDLDNDGYVDNITFVVSGYPNGWNSLLWPHQWTLSSQNVYIAGTKRVYRYSFQLASIMHTGILAHETFHVLGAPDLYHYGANGVQPVGPWDLMESTANPPEHMSCYMKWKYGHWIPAIPQLSASGTHTLNPVMSPENNCYKIASPYSTTEYFVVEYRRNTGTFESSLPGAGLLVYRININYEGNAFGPPDEVYLYRPGGTPSIDGEVNQANFSSDVGRIAINDKTDPSSFLTMRSNGGLNISRIGSAGATISFDLSVTNQTANNDDIASATAVNGYYTNTQGTISATTALDDPLFACTGGQMFNSVWYQYTPGTTGEVAIDTIGSDFDTVLGIWTGSRGHLLAMGCNDDYTDQQSQVNLILNAGTTYYIEIASKAAGGGSLAFHLKTVPPRPFNKTHPANGTVDQPTTITLNWEASAGASSYEYCYYTYATNPNTCYYWHSSGSSTSVVLSDLSEDTTYYWQVRAYNSGGSATANDPNTTFWSFTTALGPPNAFEKSMPANGSFNQPTNITLVWGSNLNASNFEYCLDTTNDNACSNWIDTGLYAEVSQGGLSPNTTYYWHVRAVNAAGTTYSNGSDTAFWSFTTIANPPGAFNKSSPDNGATNQLTSPTLSWGTSSGATSYQYCYDITDDNACSPWTSNGSSTAITLSGLEEGTTYYWHVRANNSGGTTYSNGSPTAFWSFTTASLPDGFNKISPVNGATGQSTSLTLSWTASAGATSYEYCFDITDDNACSNWANNGTSITKVLSGLSQGTTYYWHVRAINASGITYSNGSTAFWHFTTGAPPAPIYKTYPANGEAGLPIVLTLYWEGGAGATSFEYCYDTTNDNTCSNWINTGTNTSFELSGLSYNTPYYWHVRAINSFGITYSNGSSTAFWSFTTIPANFSKSSPANGATNQTANPNLSWGPSSGATSYETCYDTTNDNACSNWTSNGISTTKALSGLSPNTTYYWHVRAINTGGTTYSNASPTAHWSFTTGDLPIPFDKAMPANGATNQSTNPTLVWGSNPNASNFEYCLDTTNDNACSNWISTGLYAEITLSGLNPNTTYYWHVRASNSFGIIYSNGSSTAFWSFTTIANPPGAFSKTSPTNGATDLSTSATLSWGTSSGATSYEYCYDTTNDGACSPWTTNGTSTSKVLSGLNPGTTYYWHVRAVNSGGGTYSNASYSAYWSFTTGSAPGPFDKNNPVIGPTVILSWGPSSGATSYETCYDTTNDNTCSNWTSNGSSTTKTISSLSQGVTYYWHVRAVNANGITYSNASSTAFWSFTIQNNPSETLSVNKTGTGIGTVTSNPAGINCGSDCSEVYSYNTVVTLTASPDTGSSFTGWSGGGCSGTGNCILTMTAAMNVTASFAQGMQQTFVDVPPTHLYYQDIEILYANGLTAGCSTSPLKYCPDQIMNRGQAAVFMLKGNFGTTYVPPVPTHIFQDDWTKGPWAEPWAEGMRKEGLSAGCLANPLKYCPWDQIPREQAVIFALRLKYGKSYVPPAATGTLFADMTNPGYYATSWAEQAYTEGIIQNCGMSGGKPKFCPKDLVSRGLGAYMIVRAKNLTMP